MSSETTSKTITVAGLLCFVCSILVSLLVVNLRPQQAKNAELDMKKNILMSAGMVSANASAEEIETAFSSIETVIVDMETGKKVESISAADYDQVAASKDPSLSISIPADRDVAGLSSRPKYAKVYLKKDDSGNLDTVILNHWGKGLWSTMYGFIALANDGNTIKGFAYYSQGETPGLGGEVDNPRWKSQWVGKKLFGEDGSVAMMVAKGEGKGNHQVDGLSGATITCNGVTSSMKYWFGSHGYDKVLASIQNGGLL